MKSVTYNSNTQNVYIISDMYIASSLSIQVDGINQIDGIDYVVSAGSAITYFGKSFAEMVVSYEQVDQQSEPIISIMSAPDRTVYGSVTAGVPFGPNIEVNPGFTNNTLQSMLNILKVTPAPDSPILKLLAYNGNAKPILTERPSVPPSLCEYTIPNTSPYVADESPAPTQIDTVDAGSLSLTGGPGKLYPPDFCIEALAKKLQIYAQPGDLNYVTCGDDRAIPDLYNSTFLASIGDGAAGGGDCTPATADAAPTKSSDPTNLSNLNNLKGKDASKAGNVVRGALKSASVSGGNVSLDLDFSKISSWKDGNGMYGEDHIFWYSGDKLYGGKFEHQSSGKSRGLKNIKCGYISGRMPADGANVWFCVVSYDGKNRTEVKKGGTWKN